MFLLFMPTQVDEEMITIIQDMNDFFSKWKKESVFSDTGDAVAAEQFLGLLFVEVLPDH